MLDSAGRLGKGALAAWPTLLIILATFTMMTATANNNKTALALSQAVIGQTVGDYKFLGSDGKTIVLRELRGKPVLISMVYTSCHQICPMLTRNLAQLVNVARDALGADSFSVLSVGFDTPHDTPDRMRLFAKQQNVAVSVGASNNWHFVSADADTIERLSRDVGFSYTRSAKGFDHLLQTTVLDVDGKVYRQIYGIAPEPPALVEPLKELLYGKAAVVAGPIESLLNNIRLFCTVYDPSSGKYHFDYSIFMAIAIGLLTLAGIAWFIIRAWQSSPPQAQTRKL